MNELVSLRFVEDHRNVVVLGPVGVGKTFLRTARPPLLPCGFNVRCCARRTVAAAQESRMDNRATPS